MDRRTMLASGLAATGTAAALATQAGKAMAATPKGFPKGFRWGTASAAHQVEGNNTLSDLWLVEQVKPTMFSEPSGDANNAFELWPRDLDLVKDLGLDTYRFSIEWARIEPRPGVFSTAMLDHYARMIEGCHQRGLTPMVTFNHFTLPRWFAAQGGWTQKDAADLFARYCDKAARRLATGMGYATTLNEPNMIHLVDKGLPPQMVGMVKAMNQAAGAACGASAFKNGMLPEHDDIPLLEANMLAAHKSGRAAIKAARGDLPVGVSLTMSDDQAVGANSQCDAIRKQFYGPWLELAKQDDFIGVQNYARAVWNAQGQVQPPADTPRSQMGIEIYPASLAGAVRYAHEATGRPVMVTEHGIGIEDDAVRARFIPEALAGLQQAIADGVPVLGYVHWTLADNFEWVFGFKHKYGLCSVDRATFARTPKPSAAVLGAIAKRNAV